MRLFAAVFVLCSVVSAQVFQPTRSEISAGYSYTNIDTNGLTDRQSANGWQSATSVNVNRFLAAEAEGAGAYKNYNVLGVKISTNDYLVAGGPRVNFARYAFVHTLFGFDRLSAGALGFSKSQNSFAYVLGGGIEYPITRRVGLRTSFDFIPTRHNVFQALDPALSRETQNNFAVGVGIVLKLGRGSARTQLADSNVGPTDGYIPKLKLAGESNDSGFRISSIDGDSPVNGTGITEHDTIFAIDGKKVRSAADINTAIASSSAVRIGVLLGNLAGVERTVNVASQ